MPDNINDLPTLISSPRSVHSDGASSTYSQNSIKYSNEGCSRAAESSCERDSQVRTPLTEHPDIAEKVYTSIEEAIQNPGDVFQLNLSGFNYSEYSPGFVDNISLFENLVRLDLSANDFTCIPDCILSLPKLKELLFASNPISGNLNEVLEAAEERNPELTISVRNENSEFMSTWNGAD